MVGQDDCGSCRVGPVSVVAGSPSHAWQSSVSGRHKVPESKYVCRCIHQHPWQSRRVASGHGGWTEDGSRPGGIRTATQSSATASSMWDAAAELTQEVDGESSTRGKWQRSKEHGAAAVRMHSLSSIRDRRMRRHGLGRGTGATKPRSQRSKSKNENLNSWLECEERQGAQTLAVARPYGRAQHVTVHKNRRGPTP